jgi:hypothetical protein
MYRIASFIKKINYKSLFTSIFPPKIQEHADPDGGHDKPDEVVPVLPFQLGHVFEIHSVNPGHKG